jgi:hypothetical protein
MYLKIRLSIIKGILNFDILNQAFIINTDGSIADYNLYPFKYTTHSGLKTIMNSISFPEIYYSRSILTLSIYLIGVDGKTSYKAPVLTLGINAFQLETGVHETISAFNISTRTKVLLFRADAIKRLRIKG